MKIGVLGSGQVAKVIGTEFLKHGIGADKVY